MQESKRLVGPIAILVFAIERRNRHVSLCIPFSKKPKLNVHPLCLECLAYCMNKFSFPWGQGCTSLGSEFVENLGTSTFILAYQNNLLEDERPCGLKLGTTTVHSTLYRTRRSWLTWQLPPDAYVKWTESRRPDNLSSVHMVIYKIMS